MICNAYGNGKTVYGIGNCFSMTGNQVMSDFQYFSQRSLREIKTGHYW